MCAPCWVLDARACDMGLGVRMCRGEESLDARAFARLFLKCWVGWAVSHLHHASQEYDWCWFPLILRHSGTARISSFLLSHCLPCPAQPTLCASLPPCPAQLLPPCPAQSPLCALLLGCAGGCGYLRQRGRAAADLPGGEGDEADRHNGWCGGGAAPG